MFISYAQCREDVLLNRLFSHLDSGLYIDVGANDPVVDSVTCAFYLRGWRGINVEPVSPWYDRLMQFRPDDVNLHVALAASAGTRTIHEVKNSGLSTLIPEFAERMAGRGFVVQSYNVPADTLAAVCERHVGTRAIHFLKIDVEGAEREVLLGGDFRKFRPWVILVEATEPNSQVTAHEEWEWILTTAGYSWTLFDGLNRWYVAEERPEYLPLLAVRADEFITYHEKEERESLKEEQESPLIDELKKEISDIRESTSWKITAPLRSLRKVLGSKLGSG